MVVSEGAILSYLILIGSRDMPVSKNVTGPMKTGRTCTKFVHSEIDICDCLCENPPR